MIRNLLLLALLSLASATPVLADEIFSLKVGFASLDADGQFAGENGGSGTRVDFENDLNFDDSQDVFAEAAVQLGPFRLSGGYLPLEFSGNGAINRNITFDGQTFTAGANVASDVEIDVFDIGLAFHILNFDDGPLRVQLGPELAVKIAEIDLSFRDTSGGASENVSATVPVPTLGARGRVALSDFVGVVGRVGYLAVRDNSFLDAEIQLEYSPIPLLGVFAGYRYIDVDVDESDVVLQSTFSGVFAGVLARF
ncbi:MAG TPA: hypothetical protein VLS27_03450 [Gammaproteobacteria bacterium]|nr:hypothetical protein [Gammaproteobacteria bacterium]